MAYCFDDISDPCPDFEIDYYPDDDCAMDSCQPSGCSFNQNSCYNQRPMNSCGNQQQSIGIDQKPSVTENCWQVFLDVANFDPEDITVDAEENTIVVHARKRIQLDNYCQMGCLTNGFTRRFKLPNDFKIDDVCVCFSCDCILMITVPSKKHRNFPIQSCGPARGFIAANNNCNSCCNGKNDSCNKANSNNDNSNNDNTDAN